MASVWHQNGKILALADEELRQVATGMLQARRAMRGTLPAALIHDTALEILLSLYLTARGDARIRDLISDATLPESTVRRWLLALASEELVLIENEQARLSEHGLGQMNAMLTSVVQSQRDLLGWANH